VRRFGHVWANGDESRDHFVDALTITIVGSRIGAWLPRLLVSRGYEIVERLVILGDQDQIGAPTWLPDFDPDRVRCCLSTPTLEPSLVPENGALVGAALTAIGANIDPVTVDSVAAYFATDGPGTAKKAAFAEAIADTIDHGGVAIVTPAHIAEAFDFLWEHAAAGGVAPNGADVETGYAAPLTD
jgi:putative ATP-dependent endonuclease of the OLD family